MSIYIFHCRRPLLLLLLLFHCSSSSLPFSLFVFPPYSALWLPDTQLVRFSWSYLPTLPTASFFKT